MKSQLTILIAVLMLACSAVGVWAEEASVAAIGEEVQEAVAVMEEVAQEEAAPVRVNNKFCPTDGGDVNAMGGAFEVTHNGKVYNLCCAACEQEFRANLEKYTTIAEESEKLEMVSAEVAPEEATAQAEEIPAIEKETHDAAY